MATQYFRITMLQSWHERLRGMELPADTMRLANLRGATDCFMVVRVDTPNSMTRDQFDDRMRVALDHYDGWMQCMALTTKQGKAIEEAM